MIFVYLLTAIRNTRMAENAEFPNPEDFWIMHNALLNFHLPSFIKNVTLYGITTVLQMKSAMARLFRFEQKRFQ